ncbi:SNARE associated Golgi protein [Candidatus Rubidus massiliensis]|nr:SNARE associated Golgi protein [Candidatus Rubidus massiliensis]
MEQLFQYVCQHAEYAHLIFFGLLLLAGLNVPISEDIILLSGGAIASLCIPDKILFLYLWIYFGVIISGWEAYWLGRILGPKLYDISWLNKFVTPERIGLLHSYYERFGIFTFIIGRFIPGGVRNALILSCGLGKMPFWKFALRDALAAFISTSLIYTLGFKFAENYELIVNYFKRYNIIIIGLVIFIGSIVYYSIRNKK